MTTLWIFLLAPLLVLPFLLLFRFVGCGIDAIGTAGPIELPPRKPPPEGDTTPGPGQAPPPVDGKPPNYRSYILGKPTTGTVKHPGVVPNGGDVIAYWRLIDPAGSTVAKDEKGLYDGTYVSGTALPNVNPTAGFGGSEAAPGDIEEGKTGLILSDPAALGRSFKGGFVRADFKADLYTDEFTLEAWILAPAQRPNYEHMLIDTGGRYALPGSTARDRGFRVFEDRSGYWQVRVAIGTTDVYASPPLVPRPGASHFALVMQNSGAAGAKQLTIYIGGKLTVTATLPSYARPDKAPLFIAVENTTTTLTGTPVFRHPFMSQIQEVVLHKKPLSAEEIENHVDINR